MLEFVKKYGHNVYSQNGEDGIIQECLHRMKMTKGYCVEYGAADGRFCSNTHLLFQQGWVGTMIESDVNLFTQMKKNMVGLQCVPYHTEVNTGNVNLVLRKEIDVLSIDTDGRNDFDCLKAYTGKAKILIIEINSSVHPLVDYLDEGASYITMLNLATSKGYFLLCHTGNMVFVGKEYKDLFPEIDLDPVARVDLYFDKQWLNPTT